MTGIVQETRRDTAGIVYSVKVDGATVWIMRVDFGPTDSRAAGGPAFVRAAQRQDEVARGLANGPFVHLPWDVEYFRGGRTACGQEVAESEMGALVPESGFIASSLFGRRVDCPACLKKLGVK